jgi:hypothetical protein
LPLLCFQDILLNSLTLIILLILIFKNFGFLLILLGLCNGALIAIAWVVSKKFREYASDEGKVKILWNLIFSRL